jgi:hypothetical protein
MRGGFIFYRGGNDSLRCPDITGIKKHDFTTPTVMTLMTDEIRLELKRYADDEMEKTSALFAASGVENDDLDATTHYSLQDTPETVIEILIKYRNKFPITCSFLDGFLEEDARGNRKQNLLLAAGSAVNALTYITTNRSYSCLAGQSLLCLAITSMNELDRSQLLAACGISTSKAVLGRLLKWLSSKNKMPPNFLQYARKNGRPEMQSI